MNQYKVMAAKMLINAAKEILLKEGVDAITIRKVGEKAQFNSSTIYNYFENLEHLKIFACLFVFDSYVNDLGNYVSTENTPVENYLGIWKCFAKHSFEEIEVFYTIFFNKLDRELSYYIEEFRKLYPQENKNTLKSLDKMLSSSYVETRNIILLQELSRLGYLNEHDVEWVNNISTFTYESILHRVYKGELSKTDAESMLLFYVREILARNSIKEF